MSDRVKAGRRFLETGSTALRNRNVTRARDAFRAALTVFAGPDMGMARAHALRGMGEAAALEQDIERATRLFEDAILEYRSLAHLIEHLGLDQALIDQTKRDAVEGEALTLVMLANLSLARGEVRAAAKRINDAYPLFQQISRPASVANLWDATARVAFWEGRSAAAIRAWERALKTLEAEGDLRGMCLTALRLADAYLGTGRLDDAKRRLEEAQDVAREFEEPGLDGRVQQGWGAYYARHEQFEAALDAYEDALARFRRAKDVELELHTLIRMARVASSSGRAEVVPRLRQAITILESTSHPSALGTVLATIAEHALERAKPEIALVAIGAARRFWGDRHPLQGWASLWRPAVRALSGLGAHHAAFVAAHQLAALAPENTGLGALRDGFRRRAPPAWRTQIDALAPEALTSETDAAFDQVLGPWCAKMSVPEDKLGTAVAAMVLCDRLQDAGAAAIPVDDRGQTELRPVLIWESGESERKQIPLVHGIMTLGRGADADIPVPWDAAIGEVQCMFQRDGNQVRLLDAGTESGIFVDGKRAEERLLLGGERITFGSSRLRFEMRSAVGYVAAVGGPAEVAAPAVTIRQADRAAPAKDAAPVDDVEDPADVDGVGGPGADRGDRALGIDVA